MRSVHLYRLLLSVMGIFLGGNWLWYLHCISSEMGTGIKGLQSKSMDDGTDMGVDGPVWRWARLD